MTEEKIDTAAYMAPGDKAKIIKVSGASNVRKRLLDMGIMPGVVIEMIRPAPLGDPVQIKIKGYHLSLRKTEASHILIKKQRRKE